MSQPLAHRSTASASSLHLVTAPETRRFQVNANIIFDLIKRQAGTLSKALSENVSNSHDAGAKNVWIEVNTKGFTIRDDGPGFTSREEILRVFEVLGFVHDDKHRDFGRFGIGRAQAWAFADAVWTSNTYRMDVDIEQRGLDYDFYADQPQVDGLTIVGNFYHKLLTSELLAFEKDFTHLLRYAPLNVFLNGKQINKSPAAETWTHDTPDAWVKLKETGPLTVYNMGVLVRSYDAYNFGSGGVVVTKPGVNLALNMARNDILTAECPIWKRIRKFVQVRSDERVRTKKTKMSTGELENLTKRWLGNELSVDAVEEVKLFTDIQGRGYTLNSFCRSFGYPERPVTCAADGSRLGEQAHRTRLAFVLNQQTLDRFGVDAPTALQQVLIERFAGEIAHWGGEPWLKRAFGKATFVDDLQSVAGMLADGYVMLPRNEWKPEEKAVLFALSNSVHKIGQLMCEAGAVSKETCYRELHVGVSDTALAWTDGKERIVLERKLIEQARRGITGFMTILNVIVHECLHDSADTGTHAHDEEFYQRYHDLTTDPEFDLGKWVVKAFASYVVRMQAKKIPLRAAVFSDLNILEHAEREAQNDSADEPEAIEPERLVARAA